MGNGRNVSIWFDIWIGNDPICLLIDVIDPLEILWNVADIINSDGTWNLSVLKMIIPANLKEKILAIQLPLSGANEDSVVWKGSGNGVPTAKAFFNFISRSNEDEVYQENWMWVWKLGCTQKI